jgi:hypothetical protein
MNESQKNEAIKYAKMCLNEEVKKLTPQFKITSTRWANAIHDYRDNVNESIKNGSTSQTKLLI